MQRTSFFRLEVAGAVALAGSGALVRFALDGEACA